MASQLNPRLLTSYHGVSRITSGIVVAVGFLVLVGWLFGLSALESVFPGFTTMKANTALAFVLGGISLLLSSTRHENRQVDRIAKGCATIIVLIGVLTLSEYVFRLNFGIDQMLFRDTLTPESAYPGRMSPISALNFSLLGFSLLLLDRHQYRWPVQVFSITALIISLLALLGYVYGVSSVDQFSLYAPIASHTVVAFLLLCVSILFAHPEQGFMKIFSSENLGGAMARRLVPAAVGIPFLLGLLLLTGQRMGLYDSTFGLVLYALSMVIAFTILIWWNARLLQHADFVRQQTQVQLSASKEREAAILYAALDAVITIDYQGHVLEFNPAAQEIFGYHRTEVLGRQMSQLIIPPRFRERHRIGLAKYLETGEGPVLGKRIELMGMRADGTEFPVELTITTIATGEQPFFTGFVRDITQRKVAEAQIAYQAYLLENVNDAVIGSDENSIIRFWNQGAERMFGWKAEEAIGHPGREILRSEFIGTDRETVFKILAAQSRWKGEAILYHKDGTPVITEVSSITLRDVNGMITGYVSVNRDIAERKQAEEKIRQQNQRLKVLREIDAAILAADSVENIVGAALSHVRDLIDCRRANLTLIDWETNESVIFDVTKVNETSIPKGMRFPLDQYEDMIQALSQDQLLLMNDLRRLADPRPAIQSLLKEGLQSLCSLPFSSQGKLLGMFSMYSEIPNFFDEERISLGREVANQIAIAIKQNDLHNSLRELNVELEQRVSDRTAALSQANALLQTLLDHMLDHIYFKDSQGRFIRNSRSQASALGLSDPAEAIGKSDFDFFPHAQLSYEKEQEIMRTGKPLVNQEELVVWPDGHETWVLTTKMPLLDQTGQIIGTFGISRDITERKQSEVALHKAKLELEAANKELESFSYSVSHDLRAPLRRIDGYGQAILEDYGELLPTEGREFLERIRSAAQHMAALIDDLLNLSRVTRAPLQLMPVDLTKLAKDILEELQRSHPERTVSCSVKPNLNVRGDPRLLQVVLENLLNNAWKYSSKQGQAKIEFGAKDQNDETIYFVRDNGAGFEMAYANKLFGAFQRLHTTTEFPGTGIGLATVQRIIHRHGGRIWAESIVNQGATFFFTLPTVGGAQPKVDQEEDSMMRRVKEII